MSPTSVRLSDFPRVEGSPSDVKAQSPQEPQADQTTADAVCQARHRRRSVAQNPLLNYPLGKINRSTLPSQVIRFAGQKTVQSHPRLLQNFAPRKSAVNGPPCWPCPTGPHGVTPHGGDD